VIHVPAGADVVWIEGTGIIRQELATWIDVGIYVQGDLAEQERRLVDRDGNSPEMQRHKAGWLKEELPFMLRERPTESIGLGDRPGTAPETAPGSAPDQLSRRERSRRLAL